jgi:oligopeptidase B
MFADVTAPSLLTAKAFSAGGVVVGAALNERPELFGSAVFTNAFLDVSSGVDPLQPFTEHEYEEWGNPRVDAAAALLMAVLHIAQIQISSLPLHVRECLSLGRLTTYTYRFGMRLHMRKNINS